MRESFAHREKALIKQRNYGIKYIFRFHHHFIALGHEKNALGYSAFDLHRFL